MVRYLFLLHRWLGIGVGIVMLLWTLSGIIMMYKQYPELNQRESLALRESLTFEDCCQLPDKPFAPGEAFSSAQVEMLQGQPILRMQGENRQVYRFDLGQGVSMPQLTARDADAIANRFAERQFSGQPINKLGSIHNDQWTVYGSYNPHRPLHKYAVGDASHSEFYISSLTGEVIQLTTREQRVWGYLGGVIHWLYPTMLRQHTGLWVQVVIWLTIAGIFLTVTGLYVGIRQFKQRSSGRRSPYRGFALYHHYVGLVFGVLTLTWVGSGLLSMNPWGLLEGESARPEVERLSGRALHWRDIESIVAKIGTDTFPKETVQLNLQIVAEQPVLLAYNAEGDKRRYNPISLRQETLNEETLRQIAARMQPDENISSAEMLHKADAYYYEHHEPREFPVYRVIFNDEQQRHYYLSPVSGELLQKADANHRIYRWLFYGLHRGDFTALLRSRPVWDSFMLLFLAGVTLVCATGSYMGVKRLRRNLVTRRARKQKSNLSAATLGAGRESFGG